MSSPRDPIDYGQDGPPRRAVPRWVDLILVVVIGLAGLIAIVVTFVAVCRWLGYPLGH